MDPNAAMAQIRAIQKRMEKRAEYVEEHQTDAAWDDYRRTDEANADDRELLVELYEALDAWIVRGGFLPDEWRNGLKLSESERLDAARNGHAYLPGEDGRCAATYGVLAIRCGFEKDAARHNLHRTLEEGGEKR